MSKARKLGLVVVGSTFYLLGMKGCIEGEEKVVR